MSEVKEKKKRVSELSKECNQPSDAMLKFLKDKGFEVKTINSPVTDEMIDTAYAQYMKDRKKLEEHREKMRKLDEQRGNIDPAAEEAKKAEEQKKAEEARLAEEAKKAEEEEAARQAELEAVTAAEAESEQQTEPEPQAEVPVTEAAAEESIPRQEEQPVEETPVVQTDVSSETSDDKKITTAPKTREQREEEKQKSKTDKKHKAKETPKGKADDKKAEQPKPSETVKTEEEVKPKGKPVEDPLERTRRQGAARGLVVKGTIDLTPPKQTPRQDKGVGVKSTVSVSPAPALDADGKPKKKKIKVKSKPFEDVTVSPAKEKEKEEHPGRKRQKAKKTEIDEKEVKDNIRKTLLNMDDSALGNRAQMRKKKKKERIEEEERREEIKLAEGNRITVTEFIAVSELANLMGVQVGEVIAKCMGLGLMVSINQRLEMETITLVADEFGFQVDFEKEYSASELEDTVDEDETLLNRSPIVTIMGHVDHGKTSLLDYIRRANVVAGEAGGITQHIGAYKVEVGDGKTIAFLDTPGHEAFTAMRARGAQVTDIVVLVVAADDAVMPQTVEAINHAKAANVPIIVAINKIDKPGINLERIKQQLAERNVLLEEWGGKYQSVELSAKTGLNVDLLLEKILLEADVLDLKANPDRMARGVVVEAKLDKGRGVTATVLVQKGTLKIGDPFVAGIYNGRVRAMFDERGNKVLRAGPSTPVLVLGLESSPQAGDQFIVVESERSARDVAIKRQQLKREQDNRQVRHITLDEISRQISIGGVKELPVIVKGDVDGSVEAVADSLMKISTEEVVVRVIHRGVGAISEGDVILAAASNAIIIGFNVRPNLNARKSAEAEGVEIKIYNVIYDAINEIRSALEGMLSPIVSEEVTSTVEVRETFKVPKVGTVAGCYVLEGKIQRSNKVRLIRDGIVIFNGELTSLKRFKDDVKEVDAGFECGMGIANYNDIKIGDIIEAYKLIETKKKLD
jgi:translation initiation factor IF-2